MNASPGFMEFGRYQRIRPLLFQGLSGRILDAGVGTGRNFPFYPSSAQVTGIDISEGMLAQARRRLSSTAANVELRKMDATQMDFSEGVFDAAVATFLFCTLPDELQRLGLMELRRVVKPDGIIRLLEYTRPSGWARRIMTKLWEPWVFWAYGASFDRRTEQHVPEAGLQVVDSRFVADELIKLITIRR